MTRVIIAGGGLAGLAAAVRLSAHPLDILLLESAPRLGGRSWSFPHGHGSRRIDNGQHVLMGCYRDTLDYLERIGRSQLLERRRGLALQFVRADGRRAILQAGALPHPLGLVQAFLRYRMLSRGSRLRILRMAMSLRALRNQHLDALDAMDAASWLRFLGQCDDAVRYFWQPLVLATMNTEPAKASAKLLAVVLREIFLRDAEAADMLLPREGLSTVFVDGARELLEKRGCDIRLRNGVRALMTDEGAVRGVRLADGTELHSDALISALPPWALRRVFGETASRILPPIDFACFRPSPIVSVHVWLRGALDAGSMTGLLDTTLQWVFDKGEDADGSRHYSCTISAAADRVVDMGDEELRALLLRELRLLRADLREDDILRILPVREKRATFLPLPGMEAERPHTRCGTSGLYLAGDWTATGLPATIEGAVRSGYDAADAFAEDVLIGPGTHPSAH